MMTACRQLAAVCTFCILCSVSACSPASDDHVPAPGQVISLDPANAQRTGAAQYRCWDGKCWWVVWCGHKICDGSWSWVFPASGNYRIVWKGVKFKCAGSPSYELRINNKTVAKGKLPQHGACHDCAARRGYGIFTDLPFGTFSINKGDTVMLWAKNDFACGIQGPGAYAAHDKLLAEPGK